jgi:hypothetical protein
MTDPDTPQHVNRTVNRESGSILISRYQVESLIEQRVYRILGKNASYARLS